MILKKQPLVSILIVTLRGGINLVECLTSFSRSKYPNLEIIIVNNGGRPTIEEEIKSIFPKAKVINLKKNTGFAEGNNIGYKYCQGSYILFLNDDTIVTQDLIRLLVEFGEKYPKIAVIQPKTIFTRGILQSGADYLTFNGLLYHYGYGEDPKDIKYNVPLYMFSANGNCVLVKRNIIDKIGLFDKDFFAYFEESDFCHRVWLSGYKVSYFPKAVVYHKGAQTSRYLHRSILFYHPHKNRLCTYLKNLSLSYLIRIVPLLILLNFVVFFSYLIRFQPFAAYYVLKAIGWNILNLPKTLKKRKIIQNEIRKVDDDAYMKLVMYSPRLSYYLRWEYSKYLGQYKNDNIVEFKAIESKNSQLSSIKNVLIATFSPWQGGKRLPTNGNVEPMLNFFNPKVEQVVLIDQPYPGSDIIIPRIEEYRLGKLTGIQNSSLILYALYPYLKMRNYHPTDSPHISFKIRDLISVIGYCLKRRIKFDYFIGFESINTLAGILMKRFGLINKVIYYVSDYSPNRYPIKWLNAVYVWLDRFCAMYSDFIWDVSKAMQPARIKAGLKPSFSAPVIHVPNALKPSQIKFNSGDKIKPYSMVFMGTLKNENGPDLVIEAMPEILAKYPKATLQIIGGEEDDRKVLTKLAKSLNVEKNITFYGFVHDADDMSKIIRNCYIGLSLYRAIPGSPRYYGDAGKIRAYTAAGIPVVTTDVPPLGREVVQKGAAIMIKDNSKDLLRAIDKIFSNRKLYLKLKKNAIRFAQGNTWENTYRNAFLEMERSI